MKNAGIRTDAEYLEGLRDDREIWTRGARVKDVTAEPGIRGGTASLAGFLDRQHEEAYSDKVTFLDKTASAAPHHIWCQSPRKTSCSVAAPFMNGLHGPMGCLAGPQIIKTPQLWPSPMRPDFWHRALWDKRILSRI